MRLCTGCKHFSPNYGLCSSPKNGTSPVDGKPKPMVAVIQRSDYTLLFGDLCGPDAVNFEPRPTLCLDPPRRSYATILNARFVSFLHRCFQVFGKS